MLPPPIASRRGASGNPRRTWRTTGLALGLAGLIALGACGTSLGPDRDAPGVRTTLPRALTSAEQQAIRASNRFGLGLLREVAAANPDRNVLLSPLSASVALGMAYAGAADATETAMRQTLGWGDTPREAILSAYRELPALLSGLDPSVDVRLANAMWVRDGFSVFPSYTTDIQTHFGGSVRRGDFGPTTVADMNAWASDQTGGRIPRVVDALDPDLVVVLMNALYFKGSWRARFDPARTQPAPFTTASGALRSVPMMQRLADSLALVTTPDGTWGELPYGNTAYAMTFVLPPEGMSPRQWLAGHDAARFDAAITQLAGARVRAEVRVPRVRFEAGYQLRPALEQLGMQVAFDPNAADFSRMAQQRLFVSYVKQDAFIDVNEEGTEAAAVTQVGLMPTSMPPSLVLDRPFLFFLRERLSGTILFAGVVSDPTRTQ
jgi:serine protease inhibitor